MISPTTRRDRDAFSHSITDGGFMIELFPREGTCVVCSETRIVVEILTWKRRHEEPRKAPYRGQSFCLRCMGYSILSFIKTDMEKEAASSRFNGLIDDDVDWSDHTSPPHYLLKKQA
jgi:hypothetical protein